MFETYFGLLVLMGLAAAVPGGILLLSRLVGPRRHAPATLAPYECGVPTAGDPRRRTAVRFYLTAVLFILFDVEAAFAWAWVAAFHEAPAPYFLAMAVFLAFAVVAFAYAVAKGALEWD